jgi:hypothetical protein
VSFVGAFAVLGTLGAPVSLVASTTLEAWMADARRITPEAFDAEGRLLSPVAGKWRAGAAAVFKM